jgi:hypothetical protein
LSISANQPTGRPISKKWELSRFFKDAIAQDRLAGQTDVDASVWQAIRSSAYPESGWDEQSFEG